MDLILVDAVVTDRKDAPVLGLTAEDFVVREDGEPQAITSFEAVDLPPVAEPPSPRPDPVEARVRRSGVRVRARTGYREGAGGDDGP